jgi:hypothetical protein
MIELEAFIGFSGTLFMPIYAFCFIVSFAGLLRAIKKDASIDRYVFSSGIFFALIMWTLSASILMAGE